MLEEQVTRHAALSDSFHTAPWLYASLKQLKCAPWRYSSLAAGKRGAARRDSFARLREASVTSEHTEGRTNQRLVKLLGERFKPNNLL